MTSGNAKAVIKAIPEDQTILFLPDVYLGTWLKRSLGSREHGSLDGECHVHAGIRTPEILDTLDEYPDSDLLIYPECGCTSRFVWAAEKGTLPEDRTHVLSTEGMVNHAKTSPMKTHVVATETGLLHRLQKENPDKNFVPADAGAVCRYMKQITLEKLRDSLRDMKPQVEVEPEVAAKARQAIDRMVAIKRLD